MDGIDRGCKVPPSGWFCTRTPGHDGPCAAWPAQGTSAFGQDAQRLEAKPAGPVGSADAPNPNPLKTPPKTEGPTQ